MKNQASRDELLSAYLDDQLDVEDRARLEAQLATDPALRSELEMLRRTVVLVRDLPSQPIPHNFILPQTMAPKTRRAPKARLVVTRHPRWLAPFLTAAATVVSLLFVAVLVGDLLFSGVGGMTQLAAPAPIAEGAADSAPVEKAVEEERGGPQMLAVTDLPPSEPGEALSGAGEGENLASPGAEYAETPPPAAATLPETPETERGDDEEGAIESAPAPEGTLIPAAGGGGESPMESPAPPTSTAAKEADVATQSDTPEAEDVTPAPPPEPAATEPAERGLRATGPAPDEAWGTEPPPDDGEWGELDRDDEDIVLPYVRPWRVTEIALGVFALLLVLAMIWAWRARHR